MPVDPLPDLSLNPYLAPKRSISSSESTSVDIADILRAEEVRNKFLDREAMIRSIGMLFYFAAGIGALVAIGQIARLANALDPHRDNTLWAWVDPSISLLVASGFAAGFAFIGLGLRQFRNWARVVAIFPTALGVLASATQILRGVQSGAAGGDGLQAAGAAFLEAFLFCALVSRKNAFLFSAEYAEILAKTPHIEPRLGLPMRILLLVLYPFLLLGGLSLIGRVFVEVGS